jgi:hypothetical protein
MKKIKLAEEERAERGKIGTWLQQCFSNAKAGRSIDR